MTLWRHFAGQRRGEWPGMAMSGLELCRSALHCCGGSTITSPWEYVSNSPNVHGAAPLTLCTHCSRMTLLCPQSTWMQKSIFPSWNSKYSEQTVRAGMTIGNACFYVFTTNVLHFINTHSSTSCYRCTLPGTNPLVSQSTGDWLWRPVGSRTANSSFLCDVVFW